MAEYFLGADVGATKTHVIIAEPDGKVIGFGESGPGNHDSVGYDGLFEVLYAACQQATHSAGVRLDEMAGAGIGMGGFDWPSQRDDHMRTIMRLGLDVPVQICNDAILGLVAGSSEAWGVALVAGTGCNCRGWNREHTREGRMTGFGTEMGEGAGSSELMFRAQQAVAHQWTLRGPVTSLSEAFIRFTGAGSLDDLIEGLTTGRFELGASAAPLVFACAREGDSVAQGLVQWAGVELGEMANAVARQLEFQDQAYDVVLTGSMFQNGEILIAPLRETVMAFCPVARLVPLVAPPVVGGVLLGMQAAGLALTKELRQQLSETAAQMRSVMGR